ncbi:hypothetical protein P0L94_11115 [Microbacter sp. GSS18]|nr:hypothetical protein P0L94_11115 [Microbacter sp. GSS18]
MDIAMLSGTVSTVLFAAANLPMVLKALRSHDLRSYSFGALVVGNVANVFHTVYVFSLPFGPVWILHLFYLVSMGVMLVLWFRYGPASRPARAIACPHGGPERPRAGARGIPGARLGPGRGGLRRRAPIR